MNYRYKVQNEEIDKLFEESNLPDMVDNKLIHNLIVKIRKEK